MWIKQIDVDFKGYKDLSKDPAAAANTWYSKNQAALKGQSLDKYKVGSWAAVIKVALGKNALFKSDGKMKGIYTGLGCKPTGTDSGMFHPDFVPTATTDVCPAVGKMGDYWSVTLHATKNGGSAKPDSIYHGSYVKTAANVTSGSFAKAAYETKTVFGAHFVPSVATDFTDLAKSKLQGTKTNQTFAGTGEKPAYASNAYSSFVFKASTTAADVGTTETPGTETTCDATKWASATACQGVTTW
jgi:hypothetical protein